MDIEEAWVKALEAIEEKVGTQTSELWFKPLKVVNLENQQITLEVPNRFFKEWIEDHYPGLIAETLEKYFKKPMCLKFKVFERQENASLRKLDTKRENRRAKLASRGAPQRAGRR